MKLIRFIGTSRDELSAFPSSARNRAGHELFMVQLGRQPADWKPMPAVGAGACEIRVREESGAYRVIYVARLEDALYVLHTSLQKEANMAAKMTESSGNIFRDLGFPPHEAEVMLLRAKLAEALRVWMEREELTQAQTAKRLGVTQPRVSEIVRGKVELLSLDYLVGLCAKAGISVGVRVAA